MSYIQHDDIYSILLYKIKCQTKKGSAMKLQLSKQIPILLTALILGLSSQVASAKTATCQIDEQGRTTFKGKCNFHADSDGSFYITNTNPNRPLMRNVMDVTVNIEEKDFADVHSSNKNGNDSRWGKAKRSKACWVGSDFKVCAW